MTLAPAQVSATIVARLPAIGFMEFRRVQAGQAHQYAGTGKARRGAAATLSS